MQYVIYFILFRIYFYSYLILPTVAHITTTTCFLIAVQHGRYLFLAAKYSVLYVSITIKFTVCVCVYIYICIFLLYMKLNK